MSTRHYNNDMRKRLQAVHEGQAYRQGILDVIEFLAVMVRNSIEDKKENTNAT